MTTKNLSTLEEKIAAQQNKLAQLKAQKLRLISIDREKKNKEYRAAETRRKILLGAYLNEEMLRNEEFSNNIKKSLERWLTRDDDRALFAFPQKTVSDRIESTEKHQYSTD